MQSPQPKRTPSPPVRYRVLLVDDDVTLLCSLAAALEFELDITTCNSAERALTLLQTADFHVVCSDYSMTGMTGLDLLERIVQLQRHVGCLLITGSSAFTGHHAGGAAAHYVLVKPVEPQRMLALILQLARTAELKRSSKRSLRTEPNLER